MRTVLWLALALATFVLVAVPAAAQPPANTDKLITRIAFGSCCKQGQPQPIWDAIAGAKPDLLVMLGDNIYADTLDMDVLKAKYAMLGAEKGFQKLRSTCPILATWDDHDYGLNDAGAEYAKKKESQQIFLDFFGDAADSPRRKREGVYDAKTFGPPGREVQIVLLDTRYFRSPLMKRLAQEEPQSEPGEGINGPYAPNTDPQATVLGKEQWAWLEQQLKTPARLRIIVSSIQVAANEHYWEKWGNFPLERDRLFRAVHAAAATGVVFISGDRHHAEIARAEGGVGYPLFDVTSSSLNAPSKFTNEIGRNRVGTIYREANFGQITIDWKQEDPLVRLQVCDEKGAVVLQQRVPLSKLQPPEKLP